MSKLMMAIAPLAMMTAVPALAQAGQAMQSDAMQGPMRGQAMQTPATQDRAMAPVAAPAYVMKAGASDMYERESSKLVLATTRNAGVRSFAQMMIRDHTKSTADVKRAAMTARVPVPAPKLEPMQAQMIAELRAAKGPARDRLYITQQIAAHQMALQLHQTYASSGDAASLKAVAAATAPVVQHHLEMLQAMPAA